MKKNFLFFAFLLFFSIGIVRAEQFYKIFSTDKMQSQTSINVIYKNGVLFIDSNFGDDFVYNHAIAPESLVEYRNLNGELIKSKYFANIQIIKTLTDDKYIYIIYRDLNKNYGIKILDENLDEVSNTPIEGFDNNYDFFYFDAHNDDYTIVLATPNYREKKYEGIIITTDKSLCTSSYCELNESSSPDFMKSISNYIANNPNSVQIMSYTKMNDNYLFSTDELSPCVNGECTSYSKIILLNNNQEVIWSKNYDYSISDLIYKNNKIVGIGQIESTNNQDLLILDSEGRIETSFAIQFHINNQVNNLDFRNNRIVLSEGYSYVTCSVSTRLEDKDYCNYNESQHIIYLLKYDIETKVKEGKGNVKAETVLAPEGELIKFTVTPEEGYVLGEVKVTDTNGNVVYFTDNTFTMPNANVLIEATFVKVEEKKNPETTDIAIISISIIAIAAIIIFLTSNKKLKGAR